MVNRVFDFFRECHIDNHVTERTDLPDHLIVGSQGTEIFTQEFPRVTANFCVRVCSDSFRRMAVFYAIKCNLTHDQEQERCQQRSRLCSVFIAFGGIRVGVEALGRALVQRYPRSAHALLPNVLPGLLADVLVTVGGSI